MFFVSTFIHYFYPHSSNNHKPKMLHSSSLMILSLALLLYQLFLYYAPKTGVAILGYASQISVEEVVRLTNEKRSQSGLSTLSFNSTLSQAARSKGEDMLTKDYWAHVSPDGVEPWRFFLDAGYKYKYAGENLARDFSNAGSAVEAWMASPTHRDNILSEKYKEVGIAVVEGDLGGVDTTIIVQLFGTSYADTPPAVPIAKASEANDVGEVKAQYNPTPVPVASVIETPIPESYFIGGEDKSHETARKIMLSPFDSTRMISLSIVGVLLILLVIDGIVTSRKRIARVAGRTFAHISFLGMVLALALILKAGRII